MQSGRASVSTLDRGSDFVKKGERPGPRACGENRWEPWRSFDASEGGAGAWHRRAVVADGGACLEDCRARATAPTSPGRSGDKSGSGGWDRPPPRWLPVPFVDHLEGERRAGADCLAIAVGGLVAVRGEQPLEDVLAVNVVLGRGAVEDAELDVLAAVAVVALLLVGAWLSSPG